MGFHLPDKESNIVINLSATASLEIDKPRLTIFDYHITRLEITIEENIIFLTIQDIRHRFMRIDGGGGVADPAAIGHENHRRSAGDRVSMTPAGGLPWV